MTEDLEMAKKILDKTFCLMEWQRKDAEKRGQEVMGKEDMEFLLSIDASFEKGQIARFGEIESMDNPYNSEQFLYSLQKARNNKLEGIIIWNRLTPRDTKKVERMGYAIHYAGHGSSQWDEVYFSEEAMIRVHVSKFQNLFGGIKSFASMGVI